MLSLGLPSSQIMLTEKSRGYFRQTRELWLGLTVDEMAQPGPKRDDAWKKLGELKKSLGALKKEAGGGKDPGKKRERLLLKTAKVSPI